MFTKPLRLVGDGQINLQKMTDENKIHLIALRRRDHRSLALEVAKNFH